MNSRGRSRQQLIRHLEALERDGTWGIARSPRSPQGDVGAVGVADGAGTPAAAEIPASEVTPAEALPEGTPGGEERRASAAVPRFATLQEAADDSQTCQRCALCETRTTVVFGVGSSEARLMLIGEGPGRDEDRQGEPFVGAAGQMLNRILEAMGLRRDEVYIANTVKCRPPRNRNPQAEEMAACRPYLDAQVRFVKPEVIVLLGRVAMQAVLDTEAPLGRMRGRFHDWNGIPVMCTYHPAYLLRTPQDKGKTWQDMQAVMERLGLGRP